MPHYGSQEPTGITPTTSCFLSRSSQTVVGVNRELVLFENLSGCGVRFVYACAQCEPSQPTQNKCPPRRYTIRGFTMIQVQRITQDDEMHRIFHDYTEDVEITSDEAAAKVRNGDELMLYDERWRNHHKSFATLSLVEGWLVVETAKSDYNGVFDYWRLEFHPLEQLDDIVAGREVEPAKRYHLHKVVTWETKKG